MTNKFKTPNSNSQIKDKTALFRIWSFPFCNLLEICFLIFGTLIFAGCEKTADNIKLPETDPKLVVGCFISPQDEFITVTLTRSNPIFGPGHNNTNTSPVEDASAIISDGTNTVSIPFDNFNMQYELPTTAFGIVAGQTYSLTISTPQGESVSAVCTVPASNINALTVDFTDTASFEKKVTVKWNDLSGETNYYRVTGQIVTTSLSSPGDTTFNSMWNSTAALHNDHEKDGNEMYTKLQGYGYGGSDYRLVAYDFYLLTVDVEYYNYQNSLDNYTYGDPFSEPSPLYTNIKGGLGIFAAYQQLFVRYL